MFCEWCSQAVRLLQVGAHSVPWCGNQLMLHKKVCVSLAHLLMTVYRHRGKGSGPPSCK